MIVDLAFAMVMGIRTDSFMYIGIDMPMFIRSKIPPKFSLIGFKNMANLVQQLSKIDSNMVQHGAKMGFRTAS